MQAIFNLISSSIIAVWSMMTNIKLWEYGNNHYMTLFGLLVAIFVMSVIVEFLDRLKGDVKSGYAYHISTRVSNKLNAKHQKRVEKRKQRKERRQSRRESRKLQKDIKSGKVWDRLRG